MYAVLFTNGRLMYDCAAGMPLPNKAPDLSEIQSCLVQAVERRLMTHVSALQVLTMQQIQQHSVNATNVKHHFVYPHVLGAVGCSSVRRT